MFGLQSGINTISRSFLIQWISVVKNQAYSGGQSPTISVPCSFSQSVLSATTGNMVRNQTVSCYHAANLSEFIFGFYVFNTVSALAATAIIIGN